MVQCTPMYGIILRFSTAIHLGFQPSGRVYGLALDHSEKHIYVAGESAGGNTIYRWNGVDLQTLTARDTGSPMRPG